MIVHNAYLTDEELKQLISEAEADMVLAPPELANVIKPKNKNWEFVAYCFRVGMSVAAAVVLIFIMPYIPGFDSDNSLEGEKLFDLDTEELFDISPGEDILAETEYPTGEALRDYPSKEEVLNDENPLWRVFDNYIFIKNAD